jgi:hypothetical protein
MSTLGPNVTRTIPVTLYWESTFSDSVEASDGEVRYRVLFEPHGGLDTAASWFELDGNRTWFSDSGNAYEAVVPAVEGFLAYSVALTSARGVWGNVTEGQVTRGGTRLGKEGGIFVALTPPVIENFHYNRDREKFWAVLKDEGTALQDLSLRLEVEGRGEITAVIDPVSGAVEAAYPIPTGIQEATLSVTDSAEQTTLSRCTIMGTPPEKMETPGPGETAATYRVSMTSYGMKQRTQDANIRYLNTFRRGTQLVRECKTVLTLYNCYASCIRSALAMGWSMEKAMKGCEHCNHASERDQECSDRWVDTFAPRIRNLIYSQADGLITALIDDHGMPLSRLSISFHVESDSLSRIFYSTPLRYSFDVDSGSFLGRFPLPLEGELFDLFLNVSDEAGNSAYAHLDITAPRQGPEVVLEVVNPGGSMSFAGTEISAYLVGTCRDESGIDHDRTRLLIDGQTVRPFSIDRGRKGEHDRVYFGARMNEGTHTARMEATDNLGLSSSDTLSFNVSFPPRISDFKALPTSMQSAGGPAFTAIVEDRGKDLRKEGIRIEIDGQPVPRSRLFYDPSNGYLAVDGPFDLSPGGHTALLAATDDHGARAERVLSFIPGEQITLPVPGAGDITAERVTLLELQDHNGDGRANPGELVRLFVTLRNTGGSLLDGVKARLLSEDSFLAVESDLVEYGTIYPGGSLPPVRGFDIRIDPDVFENSPSEPYEARLSLEPTSAGGGTRALPFSLPVYRPTAPPVALPFRVTVELDPLPPNTQEPRAIVSGKAASSSSVVERVVVLVNNAPTEAEWREGTGRFTAGVPLSQGGNVIVVQATDRRGAIGSARAFINRTVPFVPPDLTITVPVQGASYNCMLPTLQGTFDTGSSGLASIQAQMTWTGLPAPLDVPLLVVGNTFNSGLGLPFIPIMNQVVPVTITVSLHTTHGDTVTRIVTFTYECWH